MTECHRAAKPDRQQRSLMLTHIVKGQESLAQTNSGRNVIQQFRIPVTAEVTETQPIIDDGINNLRQRHDGIIRRTAAKSTDV